jgi:hypothetical protein
LKTRKHFGRPLLNLIQERHQIPNILASFVEVATILPLLDPQTALCFGCSTLNAHHALDIGFQVGAVQLDLEMSNLVTFDPFRKCFR